MGDVKTFIAAGPAGTPRSAGELGEGIDAHRADAGAAGKTDRFIALIESRAFMRDCIRYSMQSALSLPLVTYSTLSELKHHLGPTLPKLLLLSLTDASAEACARALNVLPERVPGIPIIVLGSANDADLAWIALRNGAKGYIPCSMGFEIAVEAVRFVLAGGTYAPVECLNATAQPGSETPEISSPLSVITRRELAVVRAIWRGKSNKAIAYELNLCESTVKVHVRNIMKKLRAKNRTDVAIKARTTFAPSAEISDGKARVAV